VVNPRRWLLLGIFHLQAKVVDKANVLLPSLRSIANISNYFQKILGCIPLQQAWAYWSHYFGKSFISLDAHFETGNQHWNEAITLSAFLNKHVQYILSCFPSIWQHVKALPLHKTTIPAAGFWFCLGSGSTNTKNHTFKQPVNPREFVDFSGLKL